MENIKDYQRYIRGYNYTGITPVIIVFYATWCGPCQALAPMLKRLADDYDGRIKVLKVDVDKNQSLAWIKQQGAASAAGVAPLKWNPADSNESAGVLFGVEVTTMFLRPALTCKKMNAASRRF